MKIGFDVSQTGNAKAGCGYFADSLIRALAQIDSENEYLLYPTFGDVYWDSDWPTATREIFIANFRRGLGHRSFEAAKHFWSQPPSDLEAQLGHPKIIHANNFFCPTRIKKAHLIYTLYDLAFVEHPEWTTEANRVGCFNGVFNASLYSDYIVAISDYSRHCFLELFPHFPVDRIGVIYGASRFSIEPGLSRPASLGHIDSHQFWLTVGTLEPRKNHIGLFNAYAKLKANMGKTFPLVLAGGKGWLMEHLEQTVAALGLSQDVILLGYVDDVELQWLYQNCFAFVYPSLFEGFGLPIVEAMGLGAPVIASNATSIPELVRDAGLLMDPRDVDQIHEAMQHLQDGTENRERLRQKSLERARQFSWEKTARQVLDVYSYVREGE